MSPQEFMEKLYLNLLEQGWKMGEIDEMDIVYYLKLMRRKIGGEKTYIDELL